MAIIKTTCNKYDILVDDDLFEELNKYKWSSYLHTRNKKPVICRFVRGNPKKIYIHRQILEVTDPKIQIDHKNMNTLDNRRENLRICPKGAYNAINRPKQKNNTSGYKGVFKRIDGYYKNKPIYRAAIRIEQKLIHLGQFTDINQAAEAYNKAAFDAFGDFAQLNIINKEKK